MCLLFCIVLAPVVQTLDSTIHWINHYPLDNSIGFASVYPPDSDLSGGQRYPSFEQLSFEPCHILRFTMTLVSLFLSYKSQVDENQIKLFKTIKQGLLPTLLYFFLLEQMTLKLALLPLKLQVSLHYHIWQRKNHVIHFTTINLFGRDRETIIKIIRHFTKSNEFWTLNRLLYLPENFMSNNYFELIKITKEPTTKHALVFLSIIIIIIIIIYFLFCLYA